LNLFRALPLSRGEGHAGRSAVLQIHLVHWSDVFLQTGKLLATPRSSIDDGRRLISSPPPAPPRCSSPALAETHSHAAESSKHHVLLMSLVLSRQALVGAALTRGFHHAAPQSLQGKASRAASALLSAESERLTRQEGDTKSLPHHLFKPATLEGGQLGTEPSWLQHTGGGGAGALRRSRCRPVALLSRCLRQVRVGLTKETTSFLVNVSSQK